MRYAATLLTALLCVASGCGRRHHARPRPAPRATAPAPRVALRAARPSTRFVTWDVLYASLQMQRAGEPLAEAMGRSLAGYDRARLPTDLYQPPGESAARRDLAGFSTAVESYEYSRQPMNNVAFESGAGTALAYGAALNPSGLTGEAAVALVRGEVQRYAIASHAGIPSNSAGRRGFVTVPAPADNPLNRLGFSGLWPTVHPFVAFDPTIRPSNNASRGCSLENGYGANPGTASAVGDYECGYSSLHLVARRDQVEHQLAPGVTGMAAWKNALWIINYLQLFHDGEGRPVSTVPEERLAEVGRAENSVPCTRQDGRACVGGVYLGSTDLEGFQAGLLLTIVDNQAEELLRGMLTEDGATLQSLPAAESAAPRPGGALRWWPARLALEEQSDPSAELPRPSRTTIAEGAPSLEDTLALLAGFGTLAGLTDESNAALGGSPTVRAWFDGDPLPPQGSGLGAAATLRRRALTVTAVALDVLESAFADEQGRLRARVELRAPHTLLRAPLLETSSVALALDALRTARRGLGGRLTLYSDATPDGLFTRTALDALPPRSGSARAAERLTRLTLAQASALYDTLTEPDGTAYASCSLEPQRSCAPGGLDAHAAALSGLLEAWLSTAEVRYRDRAERVWARLEERFYDRPSRRWVDAPGEAVTVWTPRRFALLQSALRQAFLLLGARPESRATLGARLEGHLARLHKLVLNGWDDRNDDGLVDWPGECLLVEDGVPRGGLQLAERAQSGELGVEGGRPTADRDRDCVPELDDAMLPAALAERFELRAP